MPSALDDLQAEVLRAIEARRWSDGLDAVANSVRLINSDPASAGQIYESRDLDALCFEIGRRMSRERDWPAPSRPEGDPEMQVYVATELYEAGGHTRVLEDFIAAQPSRRHLILLTDIHSRTDRSKVEARFAADHVAIEWAPGHDSAEKLRWLAAWLLALREARVFLFTHHEDSVSVGACGAVELDRLHFYHHADHHLALGLHVPHAIHLDLTPFSFFHCRDQIGLPRVAYLPLTTPEVETRSPASFRHTAADTGFVTCSCGSEGKFAARYDFSYFELVPELLRRTKGHHLHVGPLSPPLVARLHESLTGRGVAIERLRLIKHVPSLSQALAEHDVSLYLGSWPIAGARALIETMATGTPVLGHINYAHEYLGGQSLLPVEAPLWRTPDEFLSKIAGLSVEDLQAQSTQVRRHWETFHRGRHLAEWLAPHEVRQMSPPRPQPPYEPDRLRMWLDTREGALDLTAQGRLLARAEEKWQQLEEQLERERARRIRLEERCVRLRADLDEARRSVAARLCHWWSKRPRP